MLQNPMHILIQSGGLSHITIACIAIASTLYSIHNKCSAFANQVVFAQWSCWHPHLWRRAQELSIPITAVVGLGPAVSPCARSHTLIQLSSRSSLTRSPLGHSRSFVASNPSHVWCYPSSGRSGLRNWRTIGQQAGGVSKPGTPWCFS